MKERETFLEKGIRYLNYVDLAVIVAGLTAGVVLGVPSGYTWAAYGIVSYIAGLMAQNYLKERRSKSASLRFA
ncbi:MAG: hypothetical protein NZM26_03525 [Patescibacteria group bacterium]|nr:hypothetical protein [Patescibacteria group bacterium]